MANRTIGGIQEALRRIGGAAQNIGIPVDLTQLGKPSTRTRIEEGDAHNKMPEPENPAAPQGGEGPSAVQGEKPEQDNGSDVPAPKDPSVESEPKTNPYVDIAKMAGYEVKGNPRETTMADMHRREAAERSRIDQPVDVNNTASRGYDDEGNPLQRDIGANELEDMGKALSGLDVETIDKSDVIIHSQEEIENAREKQREIEAADRARAEREGRQYSRPNKPELQMPTHAASQEEIDRMARRTGPRSSFGPIREFLKNMSSVRGSWYQHVSNMDVPEDQLPTLERARQVADKIADAIAKTIKGSGPGTHIWGKINGTRSRLDANEVGIGSMELEGLVRENPEYLNRLLSQTIGEEIDAGQMLWGEVADLINEHEVFVGVGKPPCNKPSDMLRYRLVVLKDTPRGIYLAPYMAGLADADFDGDDAGIYFDIRDISMYRSPMQSLLALDGEPKVNTDYLPNIQIKEFFDEDSRTVTVEDYIREYIIGNVKVGGQTVDMSGVIKAGVQLNEAVMGEGDVSLEEAWTNLYRAINDVAETVYKNSEKARDRFFSGILSNYIRKLQEIKGIAHIGNVIWADQWEAGQEVTELEYDDQPLVALMTSWIEATAPNNFQEFRRIVNDFIGDVEGKNASFRFTANVGMTIKLDRRFIQDDGTYLIDVSDEAAMTSFYNSVINYVMAKQMTKENKKNGRDVYAMQWLRGKVLNEVGFYDDQIEKNGTMVDKYNSFEEYLKAFIDSYNRWSAILIQGNTIYDQGMAIQTKKGSAPVKLIEEDENKHILYSRLADAFCTVYGQYTLERVFVGLRPYVGMRISEDKKPGGRTRDKNWRFYNPATGKNKSEHWSDHPVYKGDGKTLPKFGILRRCRVMTLSQLKREGRISFGDIGGTKVYQRHVGFNYEGALGRGERYTIPTDAMAQLDLLAAICDRRTGAASKYNERQYGIGRRGGPATDVNCLVAKASFLLNEIWNAQLAGNKLYGKVYVGTGNVDTEEMQVPQDAKDAMISLGQSLATSGFTLRSGHNVGCDQAFEEGARAVQNSKYELFIPEKGYNGCKNGVVVSHDKKGLNRNDRFMADRAAVMYGNDGKTMTKNKNGKYHRYFRNYFLLNQRTLDDEGNKSPIANFVACYNVNEDGGTAHLIKMATSAGIPVFNLAEYISKYSDEDDTTGESRKVAIEMWKRDVMAAADRVENDQNPLVRDRSRDLHIVVSELVKTLSLAAPDIFSMFNMDNVVGFLTSEFGLKLLEYRNDLEMLGGIWTSMVFHSKYDRIVMLKDRLSRIDERTMPGDYCIEENMVAAAMDELASSSMVWRAYMTEERVADSDPGLSFFGMMAAANGVLSFGNKSAVQQTSAKGTLYDWNVEYAAENLWTDSEWLKAHPTLRSVMEDLDMSRTDKWNVMTDVVRYWNNDLDFNSYEVGYQLEFCNSEAFVTNGSDKRSLMQTIDDFDDAFNQYAKRSEHNLQLNIDTASVRWRGVRGALMDALKFYASRPWELTRIDNLVFADAVCALRDKSYDQAKKASQNNAMNFFYQALSFLWNRGFQNDVQKTDDRMLGIGSYRDVTFADLIEVLSGEVDEIVVYDDRGRIGRLTRDGLIRSFLGREPDPDDVENDVWDIFEASPRLASCLRVHEACVLPDTNGKAYTGALIGTSDTIGRAISMKDTHDPVGHARYLLHEHPIYCALVSMLSKGKYVYDKDLKEFQYVGSVSRNERNRIARIDTYVINTILKYSSVVDYDVDEIAEAILEHIGVTKDVLSDVLADDFVRFMRHTKQYTRNDADDEIEQQSNKIYDTILKAMKSYVETIQKEVALDDMYSEAPEGDPITDTDGANSFLGMDEECEITITTVEGEKITYNSAYAAYHAQKFIDPRVQKAFAGYDNRLTFNRQLGQRRARGEIRNDWELVRRDILKEILVQKFSDDEMRAKLLATRGSDIDLKFKDGDTEIDLGTILEDIREGDVKPDRMGVDIASVASFWDAVQEFSGAKTSVSTGVEGNETYQYSVWASHMRPVDRYASIRNVTKVNDDGMFVVPDASWNGMWTDMTTDSGDTIALVVDEGGVVLNTEEIQDAISAKAERLQVAEDEIDVAIQAPQGYTVRDKTIDSLGRQVASVLVYFVTKRDFGAEGGNLMAKKAGIDGLDSVLKMRGKFMVDEDGNRVNFFKYRERLREEYRRTGDILAVKSMIAEDMLRENKKYNYKTLTKANYMCIADLMLFVGTDESGNEELYLRSLLMLISAIKHRLGFSLVPMTQEQRLAAVAKLIDDTSETAVGREEFDDAAVMVSRIRPKGKAGNNSATRLRSSSLVRNVSLLEDIVGVKDKDDNNKYTVISRNKAERYDEDIRKFDIVRDVVNGLRTARNYKIIKVEGVPKAEDDEVYQKLREEKKKAEAEKRAKDLSAVSRIGTYAVGPNNAVLILGSIGEKALKNRLDKAYENGMSVFIVSDLMEMVPDDYRDDVLPAGEGLYLIPCFDMRLNGSEAKPYTAPRFGQWQGTDRELNTVIEDPLGFFGAGDSQKVDTEEFVNKTKYIDGDVVRIDAIKSLFRNTMSNIDQRKYRVRFEIADVRTVFELVQPVDGKVRATIDLSVPKSQTKRYARAKRLYDIANKRYIDRLVNNDHRDGIVASDLEPNDIVCYAVAIIEDITDVKIDDSKTRYVLAPVRPFDLDGPTVNIPASFDVTSIGVNDDESLDTSISIGWRRETGIEDTYAKMHMWLNAANKTLSNFSDIIRRKLRFRDGLPVDSYIPAATISSRSIGTVIRLKSMASVMEDMRRDKVCYNYAIDCEDSFPETSGKYERATAYIRETLPHQKIEDSWWHANLGSTYADCKIKFSMNDSIDMFLWFECRKVLRNGSNPSDYLASYYDVDGVKFKTRIKWDYECMFESNLVYEDVWLRWLYSMRPDMVPNGLDDESEDHVWRNKKDDTGAIAQGYDHGVLQRLSPYPLDDGGTGWIWTSVFIGRHFFGAPWSGNSRPNVSGASRLLDALNAYALTGAEASPWVMTQRILWALSDYGHHPGINDIISSSRLEDVDVTDLARKLSVGDEAVDDITSWSSMRESFLSFNAKNPDSYPELRMIYNVLVSAVGKEVASNLDDVWISDLNKLGIINEGLSVDDLPPVLMPPWKRSWEGETQ